MSQPLPLRDPPVRYALTFDDGPGPSTAPLLECLRQYSVRATFFILGDNVERAAWCQGKSDKAASTARSAALAGHVLGNHTYSHLSALDAARDLMGFVRDVAHGDEVVTRLYTEACRALPVPVPFRLPFGPQPLLRRHSDGEATPIVDPRLRALERLGREHTHWTAIFEDWHPLVGGARALAREMLVHTEQCGRTGQLAVMALHDGAPADEGCRSGFARDETVEAVSLFLEQAQRRGWHAWSEGVAAEPSAATRSRLSARSPGVPAR